MEPIRRAAFTAVLAGAIAVACSSGSTGDSPAAPASPAGAASTPAASEEAVAPYAPIASLSSQYPEYFDEQSGLRAILGTPDLGVGRQRVAFVLADRLGLVKFPVSRVQTYFYPDGSQGEPSGPVETVNAHYFDFPLGVRGIYVTELEFDRAGLWGIDVSVPDPDGSRMGMRFNFEVAPTTRAPAVGDPAPPTVNRTLDEVTSVAELTTSGDPDPLLYEHSIADVLRRGRPLVVTFASPAFCTNPLCGPQVEVLSSVRERHSDLADFVHVDLYENPQEIKGDLSRAQRTPVLDEWGIETDEWTFIVGADGRVAARFESFVPEPELEAALLSTLGS